MGSEQNDETSYQPSEPNFCANNCGFFGNPATMNLCSKCYRDSRVEEEQAASAKAAMEKSLNPQAAAVVPTSFFSSSSSFLPQAAAVGPASSLSSSTPFAFGSSSSSTTSSGGDQEEKKVPNRCFSCNKKVGLTGIRCKCGSTFCGTHRYPEKHDCTFDFKAVGRDSIAKANPVVKADKIERF